MGAAIFCFVASVASLGYGLYERTSLDEAIQGLGGGTFERAGMAMSGILTIRDVRFLGMCTIAAVFFCAGLVLASMHGKAKAEPPAEPAHAAPPAE